MSDENDYKQAFNLLLSGRRKEAAAMLLPMFRRATKKGFKLQIIDSLLGALDPLEDSQKLIDISGEGIKLANELELSELKAYFMGRRADFLMAKVSVYEYDRANLKLPREWLSFATEIDQKLYKTLTAQVEQLEIEIDNLLADAVAIAEKSNSKRAFAFILMSRASVASSRYLRYKSESIRGTWKAKIWMFMHEHGFEVPLIFGLKDYKKLKHYVKSFTSDYLKAGQLLEEGGDPNSSYAYYDLAVHLQSAYKFRKAIHYLDKAKILAEKQQDKLSLAKIAELKKSIKMKNREVPNYLEGETRKEVVV